MIDRKVVMLLVATTLAIVPVANAQYFGRNKVQHETFDFKVMHTEHFDIHYYAEEEAATLLAARLAERWYTRLSILLRHQLNGRQPLVLYAAHPHFQQTNALAGEVGEGTGGVTEMFKRRIVMPFAGGMAETDHVLGHELVHAFQFDMSMRRECAREPGRPRRADAPPLVHRGHGGISLAWTRGSEHRDVGTRRGVARQDAHRGPAR